ncbi:UNVERIFIED_CONTAM: hypothetical protein HDU68_007223, partial [Siphonaria sp. JEL0065]
SPTSSASQASTAPSPVQPMRMEAYIPDSITQCTSTSTAIAVDKFAEVKQFLSKYAPLTSRKYAVANSEFNDTYDALESKKRREYQGTELAEMKIKLTEQIRKSLYMVAAQETKVNFYHLQVGARLLQLLDEFRKNDHPKGEQFAEFLAYIDQELHLKRASFYLYKAYYEFVNDFQRFKVAPVAFTALCRKLKKIQAWFTSPECKSLERQNCLSAEYWKSLPEAPSMHNRDSTFAVGFDDDDLLADFDLVEFDDD